MDGKTKTKFNMSSSKKTFAFEGARTHDERVIEASRSHIDTCFILRVDGTGVGRKFIDFNITWIRGIVLKSLF